MREQEVREILSRLSDGRWVSPNRVDFLTRLSKIYEEEGVLTPHVAPPLYEACRSADGCWAGVEQSRSAEAETPCWVGDRDGSIFWPWVGNQYRAGGICLVALNIHHRGNWWSITDEYAIAAEQIDGLQNGRRRVSNSGFAYRSLATAMAVQASLDETEPITDPNPTELPAVLERIARLQLVKCSPLGNRSRPTDSMCQQCPPRYMVRELEVLRPSVIIALGNEARCHLEMLGRIDWKEPTEGFWRGALRARNTADSITAISVPHPSSFGRTWARGQGALVDDLRACKV